MFGKDLGITQLATLLQFAIGNNYALFACLSIFEAIAGSLNTAANSNKLAGICKLKSTVEWMSRLIQAMVAVKPMPLARPVCPVSYTHLTLPTNREV